MDVTRLYIDSSLMNCFNSYFSSLQSKISHFAQRWENAGAIIRYQNLTFVKKWT